MSKPKKHRSAITGQYVDEAYARRHPRTTVSESTGKRKKAKK